MACKAAAVVKGQETQEMSDRKARELSKRREFAVKFTSWETKCKRKARDFTFQIGGGGGDVLQS